jgi:proteasome accessory factor B
MADHKTIVRQWIVIRHLARPTGATVRELAELCGVSQKTIRRDLDDLQSAGFPLNQDVQARGRKAWTLRFPHQSPGLGFSYDEALALYMSRLFMLPLAGTHLDQAAHSAYGKLRAQLSPGAIQFVDRFGGNVYVTRTGMPDYSAKIEVIDTLAHALAEGHEVVMLYHSASATEPVEYHIEPYGMCLHRAALYLVGWSRDHGEFRTFKLNRIIEVEDRGFTFARRPFELEQFLAGSFGIFHGQGDVAVRIRFSPQAARYVRESQWHASQSLHAERDGSLILTLRLSNTTELKSWVLSFGSHAEVLSPPEFRAELAEEAKRMVSQYGPAIPAAGATAATKGHRTATRQREVQPLARAADNPTSSHARAKQRSANRASGVVSKQLDAGCQ